MAQNVHLLKGIIFDKDGTLFDYVQVWGSVLSANIDRSFALLGMEDRRKAKQALLTLLGIDEEGKAIAKGLVFSHSKSAMFRRYLFFCMRYGINPIKSIKLYMDSVSASGPMVAEKLETMDFSMQQRLFDNLKEAGYTIGIITNDTHSSTNLFLEKMGLSDKVDFLCTRNSGIKPKPHVESFRRFCKQFRLEASQVAVVGDTNTDMKFARKACAGYKVAVLSGSNDRRLLEKLADAVYPDIASLFSDKRLLPGGSKK